MNRRICCLRKTQIWRSVLEEAEVPASLEPLSCWAVDHTFHMSCCNVKAQRRHRNYMPVFATACLWQCTRNRPRIHRPPRQPSEDRRRKIQPAGLQQLQLWSPRRLAGRRLRRCFQPCRECGRAWGLRNCLTLLEAGVRGNCRNFWDTGHGQCGQCSCCGRSSQHAWPDSSSCLRSSRSCQSNHCRHLHQPSVNH